MTRPASKAFLAALHKSSERINKPERVEVATCHGCPFCADHGESILDEDWACTALDGPSGFRKLTKRVIIDSNDRWLPPPKFCPLRKQDHLVTLRVK